MSSASCKLTPLDVGICSLGERHLLGDEYSDDDRLSCVLYSFLAQPPSGENVLIDLGPKTLDYTNNMFRRCGFFRVSPDGPPHPDDIVTRYGNLHDWLPRMGLTPADITDVVFTHLHADHHGMDDATDGGLCEDFPNARFHASKTGWDYNVSQRTDGNWNSYLDWAFGDFMLRMQEEGRVVFRDNHEVAPGVGTIFLGGHSTCSQAVRVETDLGPAVITSDDVYLYHLLKQGAMARISTTPERLMEATRKLVDVVLEEDGVMLPAHEPVLSDLHQEFGDEWLTEAKKLSREAADGFRRVHG